MSKSLYQTLQAGPEPISAVKAAGYGAGVTNSMPSGPSMTNHISQRVSTSAARVSSVIQALGANRDRLLGSATGAVGVQASPAAPSQPGELGSLLDSVSYLERMVEDLESTIQFINSL